MRKNKLRIILFSLFAFTGVFLLSSSFINKDIIPTIAQLQSNSSSSVETITSNFSIFESKFDENFDKRASPFSNPSYSCSAYRYAKELREPNALYLLPKKYDGAITIEGIEPLPGQFFNTTPIKGMTKITIEADTSGVLRWDDRLDFQHNLSQPFNANVTVTFDNNFFPCFFKVETTGSIKLKLSKVEITHDSYLGYVNTDLMKSGYDSYRLPGLNWSDDSDKAAVEYDVSYKPNHEGFINEKYKVYESGAKYTNLYDCAEQLRIFKNRSQSLIISNPGGYNRNDGYVKAFGDAYIKDQRYYEYDVPLAAGQTTRGTGRLVLFTKGVNSTGYLDEKQPQSLVVFTDDHYFTFVECYHHRNNNKPIWSRRFSTEIPITGCEWSPATTLERNNKIPNSGTPDSPKPEKETVELYPSGPLNLAVNEQVQFNAVLKGNGGNFEYQSENPDVASIDINTGLLTAKKSGTTKVKTRVELDNHGPVIYTNAVTVHVRESMTLNIEGDYKKNYYEGQVFDPKGLSVFVQYEDGTKDMIDPYICSWVHPTTHEKKVKLGQNEIMCIYKNNINATLNGLSISESLAPTAIKINHLSGKVQVNKPIELGVTVTPFGASDEVTWEFAGGGVSNYSGKIEGNILTPLRVRSRFEVIATSIKNNLKASVYFEVVDYLRYELIYNQSNLTNGSYTIHSCNYSFDPTIVGDDNANYSAKDGRGPIDSTKILITESPTEGAYYMQRNDNHLYYDFTSSDGVIKKSSTVPIENHIEIVNGSLMIYNQDKSKTLQFNEITKSFGMYANNTQSPVNLYKEQSKINNNIFVCDMFVNDYMYLQMYTVDQGYCKDEKHHYYKDAKEAFMRLDNDEKLLISTNSKYKAAWDRLNAWAKANGEVIELDAEGNLIYKTNDSKLITNTDSSELAIIISITIISTMSFIGFCYIKYRKRKNY